MWSILPKCADFNGCYKHGHVAAKVIKAPASWDVFYSSVFGGPERRETQQSSCQSANERLSQQCLPLLLSTYEP